MTADRPIPSSRLFLHALLTATRTAGIAGLVACLLRVHGTSEMSWATFTAVVWQLRWLVAAIFVLCLIWDFSRHVMDPDGKK